MKIFIIFLLIIFFNQLYLPSEDLGAFDVIVTFKSGTEFHFSLDRNEKENLKNAIKENLKRKFMGGNGDGL